MKDLAEKLANALRPFTADVYRPGPRRGQFNLTITGGAIHDAREAIRAYDERDQTPAPVKKDKTNG